MVTEQIISTLVSGAVAVKILDKSSDLMKWKRIKKTKMQKIKPIKKLKQLKY